MDGTSAKHCPSFFVLIALAIFILASGVKSPANAGNFDFEWHKVFGSEQEWLGAAGSELSFERYHKLIDSNSKSSPGVAQKWQILTKLIRNQHPLAQLKLVQQFFNTLPYHSDKELYLREDYWASAGEFLRNGGDCEDYAIAKYRALVDAGYDARALRIILVTNRLTGQPHAVLAARFGNSTYILDNQRQDVFLDNDLANYEPVYSMNEVGVWRHHILEDGQNLEDIAVATQSK